MKHCYNNITNNGITKRKKIELQRILATIFNIAHHFAFFYLLFQ